MNQRREYRRLRAVPDSTIHCPSCGRDILEWPSDRGTFAHAKKGPGTPHANTAELILASHRKASTPPDPEADDLRRWLEANPDEPNVWLGCHECDHEWETPRAVVEPHL